ncbi:hypothetical protein GF359_02805 [candidate division WOR-3 bacterium]|uniref:Uncharacterized protein n=1 Tax=candidate division WOR-3 bacterium TaxID=2052148 RepID=A0A9D5QBZ3_UNCW3|nr:hypothetical protein [candidate division WOR-3 bacterium]MBD3364123.1 hypothetical protein [candidate division WOR-3 bacterium]
MKNTLPFVVFLTLTVLSVNCIFIKKVPEPPPDFDADLEVSFNAVEEEFGELVRIYSELKDQYNQHIFELHEPEPQEVKDEMLIECPHEELGTPIPPVHLPERVEFLRHRQELLADCLGIMYAKFAGHLEAFHEEPGLPMPEGFQPIPKHEAWELKVPMIEENMEWFRAALDEMDRNFHGHIGGLH